jgi:hypothetical protein
VDNQIKVDHMRIYSREENVPTPRPFVALVWSMLTTSEKSLAIETPPGNKDCR